jgi:AP-2 complex subunit alpha
LQIKLLSTCSIRTPCRGAEDRQSSPASGAHIAQLTSHFKDFDRDCVGLDRSQRHAVLFESVNLIVCWGSSGPAQLRDGTMLLGKFISVRELTFDYLGLLTMARDLETHVSLKDADISVRRRALDLLFVM